MIDKFVADGSLVRGVEEPDPAPIASSASSASTTNPGEMIEPAFKDVDIDDEFDSDFDSTESESEEEGVEYKTTGPKLDSDGLIDEEGEEKAKKKRKLDSLMAPASGASSAMANRDMLRVQRKERAKNKGLSCIFFL
jgi:hypothetical protein